ncbi:MAG TPA: glycosyltransferase [Solirubrobacteraceae bacterium]|jgi:glycosyltransferase involved in cell wall biosynthesis|nr:glycosyltransferase [Solirubrobacteraceae bacterium]
MADPPRLQGRDIVCVGFADWDTALQTNQHHLMKRLAAENKVLFVESLGLRRPQLAGRDLKRIARRLSRGLSGAREVDGLHVLSPLVLPLHANAFVRALNRRLLEMFVRRAARKLGMQQPILWAYVPQAESLLEVLQPELVVYHCVDDIAAQPGIDAASFRTAETRFARRAELVLASAPALAERLRSISDNVIYAPNVADTALFASALEEGPIDPGMARLPAPRIVFTGAVVATKLDMGLLIQLARFRPSWSFALVGPVGAGDPSTDVSALAAEPNIHLLGARTYEHLPSVLRGAEAGLIPYARNQLTDSIFPMKVYEYLAAGLPVVATPLPSLTEIDAVASAPDADGIARLLDEALAEDTPQRRAARSQAAAAHSWEGRIEQIATVIDALPKDGRDLLVSTHTPALRSGRDVRTYGIARALAMNGPLTLLYVRFGADRPDEAFSAIPGIVLQEVIASRGIRRAVAYVKARLGRVPSGLARGVSPELASAATRWAGSSNYRRVIADGPTAAAALAGLARRRPVIYNAHNLESAFRHELPDDDGSLRGLHSFERRLLRASSESWMVSEADMRGARALCPEAKLRLAPNVVDVSAIRPVFATPPRSDLSSASEPLATPEPASASSEPARTLATEPVAIFVANFAYTPNRNALTFLIEEVLPRAWQQLPNAQLILVGAGLEHPPSKDPRVRALGFVEDLAGAYAQVRCAVVPLLQGGGSPLKLVEALAYGLPVVATPRAVAGLDIQDGIDCLVAEGSRAFADTLVQVLRDGAPEIARAGRRLAEQRYSVEALAGLLGRQ